MKGCFLWRFNMKSNRIIWGLVSLVVLVTIAISLGTMTSHSQKDTSKEQENEGYKDFPSVEYSSERIVDEVRKVKSQKYNKYKILDPNISKDNKEVSFVDWLTASSPLPTAESQIIVLGKVVTAQAHLSENKNSVYSEFKIEIEKILKNSSKSELEIGKCINAEREGGIVRFPSGKETWYLVSGQHMPKVGSRYIFFLTPDFPSYGLKQDLFLMTGYELRNGKVFPLDSPDGGTHPIATFYKGKEESVLLNDLQNALENSTNVLPK